MGRSPRFRGPTARSHPHAAPETGDARPLRPEYGAARAGEKAGLDEQGQSLAVDDRQAVESLDREAAAAIGPHPRDERLDRGPEPRGVRVAERKQ